MTRNAFNNENNVSAGEMLANKREQTIETKSVTLL